MEDVYADGVVMFQHRRYFLVSSALCFGLPTLIGTCFAVAVRCRCICSCRCCKHGLTSRAMSTTNGVRRGSGGGQEGVRTMLGARPPTRTNRTGGAGL
eukprot:7687938-Pyramimonas_sp.AAC.1